MTENVVSRHHEWRGPANYAKEDRNVVLCMDCGVRCEIGDWASAPPCRPKIERPETGYKGTPLAEYMAMCRDDPDANPWPGGLIVLKEPPK
jgi:hypothetical protein